MAGQTLSPARTRQRNSAPAASSAAHHSRCSAPRRSARFQGSIGPTAIAATSGMASGAAAVLKKGGPTEIFVPVSRSANIG